MLMHAILLIILPVLCHTSDNVCQKAEGLNGWTGWIPGTESDWVSVWLKIEVFAAELKARLQAEGLGQVAGEMAQAAQLPGTRRDWRRKFAEVTQENILGAWDDLLAMVNNGQY